MSDKLVKIGGRKAALECLKFSSKRVTEVLIKKGIKLDSEIESLLANHTLKELDFDTFEEEAPQRSQGIVVLMRQKSSLGEDEFLKKYKERDYSIVLFLDGIKDVGNFGSILRLAEASGVDGVYYLKNRAAPLNDDVRSYSVGASELVDTVKITNAASSLKKLQKVGYWVVSTTLEESSRNYWDIDWPQKTVLVIGSEEKGVSKSVINCSDFLVKIPMFGKVQSLNAAHSAAISLYEIKRRFKDK